MEKIVVWKYKGQAYNWNMEKVICSSSLSSGRNQRNEDTLTDPELTPAGRNIRTA